MVHEGPVAPTERVYLTYVPAIGNTTRGIELPFRLLVISDFTGRADTTPLEDRKPIRIDRENFDDVIRVLGPSVELRGERETLNMSEEAHVVPLRFGRLRDFEPESLVRQMPETMASLERRAARAALGTPEKGAALDPEADPEIVALDKLINRQLDEILHNVEFQRLEAAWRSLRVLVDRTDFRENIRIDLLCVSRSELRASFDSAMEPGNSSFSRLVAQAGVYGIYQPMGAIIADYVFGTDPADIKLLKACAAVAAHNQAPFIAAASPQFFGVDTYRNLQEPEAIRSVFDRPSHGEWNAFRESEDARFVGLTCPRFLLRPPYCPGENPTSTLRYEEGISPDHRELLWGNSAFAFATCLTGSFARYRWCPNIVGERHGGVVTGLPTYTYRDPEGLETRIQTEAWLSDRLENELAEAGFMGLMLHRDSDNPSFISGRSCARPRLPGPGEEDTEARLKAILGSRLPYVFLACRLVHYLKVLRRENIAAWKDRKQAERGLNSWLAQQVVSGDLLDSRAFPPLRKAGVVLHESEDNPGEHDFELHVRPNFQYGDHYFTISLEGRL